MLLSTRFLRMSQYAAPKMNSWLQTTSRSLRHLSPPIVGGCYCGNITFAMRLPTKTEVPETYVARACDCGFCRKNGAAYISDPHGELEINVKDTAYLGRFRQNADGNAEFLHCKRCSVLIGAIHQCIEDPSPDPQIIGAINRLAVENAEDVFPTVSKVQPRLLSNEAKVKRWKERWFQNIKLSLSSQP